MSTLFQSGVGGLNVEINELKSDSLDLHLPPEVQVDLEKGRSVVYNTVSPVEGLEEVEFHVPPDPECFFILNQTRIEGHFVVQDEDGGNVTATNEVTLSNHFAACLFSQIEIYLNGTQVCDLSSILSYPYKQHLDQTLSYHFNTLNNVGRAEGYYLSERENCSFNFAQRGVDTTTSCTDMVTHHQYILDGKKVYFYSTLPADILYTDKYLPPNVEISIKLSRFNPKMGLIQNEPEKSYSIYLKDLKLHMRKVLPTPQARERFKNKLMERPSFLPYKDSQLKHYHIPRGSSVFSVNHINNLLLPNQIYFFFIKSKIFKKEKSNNWPFELGNQNLSSVMLKKNGKPIIPKLMEFDFSTGNYVELYTHFQDNVNSKNRVTLNNHADNLMVLAFDLTPDKCQSFHNHPSVSGNLELDLAFGWPTDEDITLISYAFYNCGITIDKNLQVTKMKY